MDSSRSELQLLRQCCWFVLICTCATLLCGIQQLARAEDSDAAERLIDEIENIVCSWDSNEDLRREFQDSVRESEGEGERYTRIAAIGQDASVRCRADRLSECRETDVSVTWCIHIPHPEEKIKFCYNSAGHVTNITETAAMLRLQDRYQVQPQSTTNLLLVRPQYFMGASYLSCTARSDSCYAKAYTSLKVSGSGEDDTPPELTFDSSGDLFLNKTNIFACNASVSEVNTRLAIKGGWKVNGVAFERYVNHNPYCDTNSSLSSGECSGSDSPEITAELERQRIRIHLVKYTIRNCPFNIIRLVTWLVIENATADDASNNYECYAEYTITNPTPNIIKSQDSLHVNPVYPLIEVVTLDRPQINSTYLPEPGESPLQWRCSVLAGMGDRLIWTLDDNNLANITLSAEDLVSNKSLLCSSFENLGDIVAVYETNEVGEYERQYTSTLFYCGITTPPAGLYDCSVIRTMARGDQVKIPIWSTLVPSTTPTTAPSMLPQVTIRLKIVFSATLIVTLILIILAAAVGALLVRHCRRKSNHQHAVWKLAMGSIAVTDDILTEFRRRNSLSLKKEEPVGPTVAVDHDPLEFPRDKLVLLDRVLGEGTFGIVRYARAEGIVEDTPEKNIVAVKTTKSKAPPHEINNFWEELQLMKTMAPHMNIVNLLGYCTTPGGPVYMIIEYADHGSLKNFLKSCEEAVLKLNHVPQVHSFRSRRTTSANSSSGPFPHVCSKVSLSANNSVFSTGGTPTPVMTANNSCSKFDFSAKSVATKFARDRLITQDSGFFGENVDLSSQSTFGGMSGGSGGCVTSMTHMVAPLTHDYINSKGLLYMEDVKNFALQIACGLKHLEDLQIVHCDLAARNILIAEGFVLKIGDFGMARDVSEKEYYRKQGGQIPVKWTAPEALKDHIFTFKSDVWSFGVILWEIFTYGQQPYTKFKIRHSWEPFINHIMEGNRLSQPNGCPDSFYNLMQSCWHSSPDQRPTAEELLQVLSQTNLLYEELEEEEELTRSDANTQLSSEPSNRDGYINPWETQV